MARENGSSTTTTRHHKQRSVSKSPSPRRSDQRDRVGSEAPSGDDTKSGKKYNLAIPICRDFTRGRCSRSQLECRYAHPPPVVEAEGEEVTVCYDSLRDRCARGYACRYFHPPPHLRLKMQESIGIQPSPTPLGYQANSVRHSTITYVPPILSPPPLPVAPASPSLSAPKIVTKPAIEVCRDFLRGRCTREAEECRFAHHTLAGGDGEHAIVCQDFLRGKCTREACRYFHAPENLKSQIKDLSVVAAPVVDSYQGHDNPGLDVPYAYATVPYEHQAGKRMRFDGSFAQHHRGASGPFYGGGYGSSLYPVSQFPPLVMPSPQFPPVTALWAPVASDQEKLPVCRDFLRDKCSRSMACRFVHPGPYTQVVDNYVTVCRDSVRGKCKREQCRFYHPPTSASKQDNDSLQV